MPNYSAQEICELLHAGRLSVQGAAKLIDQKVQEAAAPNDAAREQQRFILAGLAMNGAILSSIEGLDPAQATVVAGVAVQYANALLAELDK